MNKLLPIALGVGLAIGGGAYFMGQQGTGTTAISNLSPVQPALAQDIELAPDMVLGQADAPVEIVEYASFTCPHCADFHKRVYDKLKAEYIDTGKVKLVSREVYFDKYGLWAGLVARCGGEMRYFGITDMIYTEQDEWIGGGSESDILDNLKTIGKKAGLSEDQLEICVNDQAMAQSMVAAYQKNAGEDGVRGTPTFFINGEKYPNMSYDDLKAVIDGLLEG